MINNEDQLDELRKQMKSLETEIVKREYGHLLLQMRERIRSYQASVHTVSEELWQDLIEKDHLAPHQRESYRLIYDYCVVVEERRALQEQFSNKFNNIAKRKGYEAAVIWKKTTPYIKPVFDTFSFVAAAIAIHDRLISGSSPKAETPKLTKTTSNKPSSLPHKPNDKTSNKNSLGSNYTDDIENGNGDSPEWWRPQWQKNISSNTTARRLISQLVHPNERVRDRALYRLQRPESDISIADRLELFSYLRPIMRKLDSTFAVS